MLSGVHECEMPVFVKVWRIYIPLQYIKTFAVSEAFRRQTWNLVSNPLCWLHAYVKILDGSLGITILLNYHAVFRVSTLIKMNQCTKKIQEDYVSLNAYFPLFQRKKILPPYSLKDKFSLYIHFFYCPIMFHQIHLQMYLIFSMRLFWFSKEISEKSNFYFSSKLQNKKSSWCFNTDLQFTPFIV